MKYKYFIDTNSNIIDDAFNLKMTTMGGLFFWETLDESDRLRLQQNRFTEHCRILDLKNRRIAWGVRKRMEDLFAFLTWKDCLLPGDVICVRRDAGIKGITLYEHYGIYAGEDEVIHYASPTGDLNELDDIAVRKQPMEMFLRESDTFYVLHFPTITPDDELKYFVNFISGFGSILAFNSLLFPLTFLNLSLSFPLALKSVTEINKLIYGLKKAEYRLFSHEESLRRAISRLGERAYNLITNNCEHLAMWSRIGWEESTQVNRVLQTGVVNIAAKIPLKAEILKNNIV